jgi:HSP20 family protein
MARKKEELARTEPRFLSPFEEMERWFDEFFRRPFSAFPSLWRRPLPLEEEVFPSVDIYEEGNDLVLKAEVPGIKKEDLEVKITEDTITIAGEKKKEEKVEKKDYYRIERSYGSFSRSFSLPSDLEVEKAKAKFENGILELRIPKSEKAKKKEIKISLE